MQSKLLFGGSAPSETELSGDKLHAWFGVFKA